MRLRNGTLCLCLAGASVFAMAANQQEFTGKLNPKLLPGGGGAARLSPAKQEIIDKLPKRPGKKYEVLAGTLRIGKLKYETVVVASKEKKGYFYLDLNQDGKFEKNEKFKLPKKDKSTALTLPIAIGPYAGIPAKTQYVDFVLKPPPVKAAETAKTPATQEVSKPAVVSAAPIIPEAAAKPKIVPAVPMVPMVPGGTVVKPGEIQHIRMLEVSVATGLEGYVDIGGRKTLVKYSLNLQDHGVDPLHGRMQVDTNGDGKIETYPANTESMTAKGTAPVFRVGTHYVSTKSVDLSTGTIVMESHPASDYKLIELAMGSEIPNFAFTDLDGKPMELSGFRGKYLLLDFWGSW